MGTTEIIEKAQKMHNDVMRKLMQPYLEWKQQSSDKRSK